MHILHPSASRTGILTLPAHYSHGGGMCVGAGGALKECLGLRPTFGMSHVNYLW